jgi:hypothetical protein
MPLKLEHHAYTRGVTSEINYERVKDSPKHYVSGHIHRPVFIQNPVLFIFQNTTFRR